MPAKTSCLRALLFIAGFSSAHSVLAQNSALTVEAIAREGKTLPAGETVTLKVIENGLGREQPVKIGDSFPVGVVLVTPPKVRLEVKTCNGNEIALIPLLSGTRFRVFSCSGHGEEHGLDEGKAVFVVKRALDFFNVRHDRFQALVRGTTYSVEVVPDKEIRFAVEEGKVRIEREAKIHIEKGQKEGQQTVSELLNAGDPPKIYRLDTDEYLARYRHFGEAEAYYREQLKKDRESGDLDQFKQGLIQMGNILQILSRDAEALPYYEEYLQIVRRKYPGGVHNDIARIVSNLGSTYSDFSGAENVKRAIVHYEEALNIQRQLFPGGVHNDIASVLNNLGVAYTKLDGNENIQRAIAYYEKSLKIRRQLFSSGEHNGIANILNNLGVAYRNLGGNENVQRAIAHYEEALEIRRQIFPTGVHNDIAGTLNNLGVAYTKIGNTRNLQRAITYHEEALKIQRQLFPNGVHNNIADTLKNLGIAYWTLSGTDNIQHAIAYFEEALNIRRQLFPDSRQLADAFGNLAFSRLFTGDYEQALRDTREGLKLDPEAIWIHTNEAHALLFLSRFDEARAIHLHYRDQKINTRQTFREAVLEDFVALRKAGVEHPDMVKIEALLTP